MTTSGDAGLGRWKSKGTTGEAGRVARPSGMHAVAQILVMATATRRQLQRREDRPPVRISRASPRIDVV